jgi:low affinity Fe/Cu permease
MFDRFAHWVSTESGKPPIFIAACACIAVWAACGPFFGYSDTWQLIINTGTTVVTFLMVFLIQNTQARDTIAIKLQLGEIIRAINEADDRLISLDRFTEQQLQELATRYREKANDA